MKKLKIVFIKIFGNVVFMCAVISISQCCLGKVYQVPESKELREKVRNKVKDRDMIV